MSGSSEVKLGDSVLIVDAYVLVGVSKLSLNYQQAQLLSLTEA